MPVWLGALFVAVCAAPYAVVAWFSVFGVPKQKR